MEHVLEWITTHSNVFAWGAGRDNVVMVSENLKNTRFYLLQDTYIVIFLHPNTFVKSVRSKRLHLIKMNNANIRFTCKTSINQILFFWKKREFGMLNEK